MDKEIIIIKQLVSVLLSSNVRFDNLTINGVRNLHSIVDLAQKHVLEYEAAGQQEIDLQAIPDGDSDE